MAYTYMGVGVMIDPTNMRKEIEFLTSERTRLLRENEALRRVAEAAKELINDMDCYCLDSEESLGRGPCETCKLAEALQALRGSK